MDYQGLALLVTAGGTFVAAVGGVIVSIRNTRRIEKVADHVAKVETATNGLVEKLVAGGKREGIAQERAAEAARDRSGE